jgi:hypothetical protein
MAANGLGIFFRVVRDGACFPADSKREIALFVVPISSATASWVKPDFERADNISRTRVYSSSSSLYALLNPFRFWAFLMNAIWSWETGSYFNSTILYLLQPFPGYIQFLLWRVRCFLDKRVKNYSTLTDEKKIKYPSNTFATSRP